MGKQSLTKTLKNEFIIKSIVMLGLMPILLFIFMLSGRSGLGLYQAFVFVFYIQVVITIISYIINRRKLDKKYKIIRYFIFQVIYVIIMCLIVTMIYALLRYK